MAGGIVLGSIAISAVSGSVLPYILVAIIASFLKINICNICNIAKFFFCCKFKIFNLMEVLFIFSKKSLQLLGGFSQNVKVGTYKPLAVQLMFYFRIGL